MMEDEPKFEIIGKNNQMLQILLAPGDKIETAPNCVLYSSANLRVKEKASNLWDIFSYTKDLKTKYTRLKVFSNESSTFAYLGLSKRTGQIIVFDSINDVDMCFKPHNLLAHSSNISLDLNTRIYQLGLHTWNKISPSFQIEKITQRSLLFLHSDKSLIEKRLAINEEVIVKKSAIFAFKSTIKFSDVGQQQFGHPSVFVKAKGPGNIFISPLFEGLIVFENNADPPNFATQASILPIVSLWFYILVTIWIWYLT